MLASGNGSGFTHTFIHPLVKDLWTDPLVQHDNAEENEQYKQWSIHRL